MWLWDCKTCTDIYLETHDKCVRVGRPVVIHTEASTVSAVKEILYAVTTQFSTCSWSWISLWMDLTMRDLSSAHHVHNSALYVCVHNHQPLLPQYRPDVMCSHSLHRKWLPSLIPRLFLEGGSEPGDEGGGYPTVLCSYPSFAFRHFHSEFNIHYTVTYNGAHTYRIVATI